MLVLVRIGLGTAPPTLHERDRRERRLDGLVGRVREGAIARCDGVMDEVSPAAIDGLHAGSCAHSPVHLI